MTKCKTPCPNKCKEQMILRKDLDEHLTEQCVNRAYKCQYCGKKDTYANITDIHDDLCEKKPHPCPNPDCSESMQRAEIKQHLDNDCEHTVISCKYEGIGCDMKMKRKDMGAHEQDDKAHLHQALNTVVKLQDDLQSATKSMKKESDDIAVKLRKESNVKLKRKSNDMATKLRKESNDMAVQLRGESNNMAVKLRREREDIRSNGFILLFICFLLFICCLLLSFHLGRNNNENTSLKKDIVSANETLKLMKRESAVMKKDSDDMKRDIVVKFKSIKKESDDMAVKLKSSTEEIESMKKVIKDELRSATKTIASMKKENKAVQDRLQSVTETITSMQKKLKSVLFKIINYEKKKKNNEVFYSQSFYTGIDGYNMCIKVHPNGVGDGKGTHVSVYTHILKGDNDDNLKWPLIGTVKLELLNQLEDKNHHLKTVPFNQEDNKRVGSIWGYRTFIPHSQLSHDPVNNTQYLKDHTLYFRVSVEVSGHKPWLECTLK